MLHIGRPVARRAIIKGAGLGAGLMSGLVPLGIHAAAATSEAEANAPVWGGEYWASKGDVPLYMFRKRAGPPKQIGRAHV